MSKELCNDHDVPPRNRKYKPGSKLLSFFLRSPCPGFQRFVRHHLPLLAFEEQTHADDAPKEYEEDAFDDLEQNAEEDDWIIFFHDTPLFAIIFPFRACIFPVTGIIYPMILPNKVS